jgi:outer membrane protein assembly factor BamA
MRIKWLLFAAAGIAMLAGAHAEDRTATARPPVVRAVEFKNFHGVSVKEIVNRLNDRDIRLVEEPYSKQYVATVQGIVEELMAEKGQAGIHVKPTVVTIPPNSVRVTFTAASD